MKIAKRRIDGIKQGYHIKPKQKGIDVAVLKFNINSVINSYDIMNKKYPGDELYKISYKEDPIRVAKAKKIINAYPYVFDLEQFINHLKWDIINEHIKDGRVIIYMPKNLLLELKKHRFFYIKDNKIFFLMDEISELMNEKDLLNSENNNHFKYFISKELYDKTYLKEYKIYNKVGVLKDA